MVVGWRGSAGKRTGVQLPVLTMYGSQSPATPAPGDPKLSSPPRAADPHRIHIHFLKKLYLILSMD